MLIMWKGDRVVEKYRIVVDSCLDYNADIFDKDGVFYRVPFGINIDDENIIDKIFPLDSLIFTINSSVFKFLSIIFSSSILIPKGTL